MPTYSDDYVHELKANLHDAAILIFRLCRALPEDLNLRQQAEGWLDRKGLRSGSILRDAIARGDSSWLET